MLLTWIVLDWCAGLCGFRLLFCMLVVFVLGALIVVIGGNAVLVLIVCFRLGLRSFSVTCVRFMCLIVL